MKNRSPFVKGKSQASSQPQNNPTKKSRPLSSKKPLKPLKPSNTTSKKNIKQEKKKYTKYNPDLPIIHQHLKDFIQADKKNGYNIICISCQQNDQSLMDILNTSSYI